MMLPSLKLEKVDSATSSSTTYSNAWKMGDVAELKVYITSDPEILTVKDLIWHEENIVFGGFQQTQYRFKDISIPTPRDTSLILIAFLKRTNGSLPFEATKYNTVPLHYSLLETIAHETRKGRNLLFDTPDQVDFNKGAQDTNVKRQLCYRSNLTLRYVSDPAQLSVKSLTPFMKQYVLLADPQLYLPIFYANNFWNLKEHCIPVDHSLPMLDLRIEFEPVSFWRFQLAAQFAESMHFQEEAYGLDTEDIKRLICETNVILLCITIAVSSLHTIFDILAFKNDIQFWKNRKAKDLTGLSIRTIGLSATSQFIIFLYLLEEKTNWLVLSSVGFGILLDVWKLTKATNLVLYSSFPFLSFEFKKDYTHTETKLYDDMALKYLSWTAVPLLATYAAYALWIETFTSWYSFTIKTLVGFVYAFGFIMMTPQLFINYKLKSIAHMPWRSFVYKALNTFIDDLFAFVIRMPMLHRLACLRDDVVFVIYLYQRYLYPVDKKRRNEFGQLGEEPLPSLEGDVASDVQEDKDQNQHPEPEPRRGHPQTNSA